MARKTKRQRAQEKRQRMKRVMRSVDWVIALTGLGVFLMVLFFVLLPFTQKVKSDRREIKQLDDKIVKTQKYIDDLNALDEVQMDLDQERLNMVMPQDMEVSSFAGYVDQLALKNSLSLQSFSSANSEVIVDDKDKTDGGSEKDTKTARKPLSKDDGNSASHTKLRKGALLGYDMVSGPFIYKGKYNDIANFLSEVQDLSPYLVVITSVRMENVGKTTYEDEWEVALTVTGYYSSNIAVDSSIDIEKGFVPYTTMQSVLQFVYSKAQKFNE